MRKLISWFGFSNSNRTVALKLLTIASAGDDVHGYVFPFDDFAAMWADLRAGTLRRSFS